MFGTFPAHEVNSWLVPMSLCSTASYAILRSTMVMPVAVHTLLQKSRFWGKRTSKDDQSLSCKRTKWVYTEMVKLNNKLCTMRLMCFVRRVRLSIGSRKVVLCAMYYTFGLEMVQFVAINTHTHTHILPLSRTHARVAVERAWRLDCSGFTHGTLRCILRIFIFAATKQEVTLAIAEGITRIRTHLVCACQFVCVFVGECVIGTH